MLRARLDPETLLNAYSQGAFPMADRNGFGAVVHRGPAGNHPAGEIPRRQNAVAENPQHAGDRDSDQPRLPRDHARLPGRSARRDLDQRRPDLRLRPPARTGLRHSVETWWDGELAGGLYGVSLGGAFFGESMFHQRTDASKIALVALVDRLKDRNFTLLDAQASTKHLKKFGCVDISAADYQRRLATALHQRVTFV